ncbi:MAG: LarC family nickel insertion protein [Eubacterium sp.]|nr:LarC family nickel insertion protein [Eubacterium sp.]
MKEKILYLECKTGAAGDMLMAALYDVMNEEQKAVFLETMNGLVESVTVAAEKKVSRGIAGVHMKVTVQGEEEGEHLDGHDHEHHHHHEHGHEHHHRHEHNHCHEHTHFHHVHVSYKDLLAHIMELPVSNQVKQNASTVYQLLGMAESKVHGTDIEQIHFHEVGSLDALVDIVGCALAMEMIAPDKIYAAPVCVGNGTVRCAHGVLPVPAPATAELIKGMPTYSSKFDGELLTPTGAAVLKHYVQNYTKEISMEIKDIGYGMGTKEFEQPSFVRAFVGWTS